MIIMKKGLISNFRGVAELGLAAQGTRVPRGTGKCSMAYRAWKDTGNTLSLWAIASKFQVSRTTLQGRAKGAIPKRESNAAKRRLCVREEEALKDWCIQLAKWGWPPRVCQLQTMATELL